MNQGGHSDMTGLFFLLMVVSVACFLIEGTFIGLTIGYWQSLGARITFGVAAILGAAVITYYIAKLWRQGNHGR